MMPMPRMAVVKPSMLKIYKTCDWWRRIHILLRPHSPKYARIPIIEYTFFAREDCVYKTKELGFTPMGYWRRYVPQI